MCLARVILFSAATRPPPIYLSCNWQPTLTPPPPSSSQVGFLACLKEFADFLEERGARGAGTGGGTAAGPLLLRFPIEGDKVGGLSIKLLLQKVRTGKSVATGQVE